MLGLVPGLVQVLNLESEQGWGLAFGMVREIGRGLVREMTQGSDLELDLEKVQMMDRGLIWAMVQ